MLLSVLITAAGFIGLFVTIFGMYFEIIPSKKNKITKKNMTLIIVLSALLILGATNLYYIRNMDIIEAPDDDDSKDNSKTEIDDSDFPQEKLFVEENSDYIQKIKSSYSEADTITIEDNTVNFRIVEKAGLIFQDLMKTGEPEILDGSFVRYAKMIILDYNSDEIIYTYNSQNGRIHHSPGSNNKFYCVVVHDDYDLYVTPPIQVTNKDHDKYYNGIDICLNKKNSIYTPLSQISLYMRYLRTNDDTLSAISSEYNIHFSCRNTIDNGSSSSIQTRMSNSGILSYSGKSFFSINTNYIMDIYLYHKSDDNNVLAQQTFDGSVIDSNLTEIIFEVDDENDTIE